MPFEQTLFVPVWTLIIWTTITLFLGATSLVLYLRLHFSRSSLLDARADAQSRHDALIRQIDHEKILLEKERAHNLQLQKELVQLQTLNQEQEKRWQAELTLLKHAKDVLSKEFEGVAGRLFEAKQEHYSRAAKIQMEAVIQPFRDQLQDFRQRVDEAQHRDTAQHHQLMGQILELQKQSQQIGADAINLANALKGNNKILGSWGELILTKILEQTGFQRGREFDLQASYINKDGKRLLPDAVIHLPENRDIVIDAKVSLLAYERYICAETESERRSALKDHIESLKNHVRDLGAKNYSELLQAGSVDFVCLFVPIESAFVTAVEHAPDLMQTAYERKIILVSPSSLFVVLRVVTGLWQRERQDRNVEQIVECAGRLYDQFVRFYESLQEVGAGIDRANRAYQIATNRLAAGNGNLIKRVEDLRKLGAKTNKTLPQTARDQAELEE